LGTSPGMPPFATPDETDQFLSAWRRTVRYTGLPKSRISAAQRLIASSSAPLKIAGSPALSDGS
jgi:hypothetical protein